MAADHLQGVESPNDHPKSILGASGAKLRLEYRKASELVENPKNWRRHPQSQIDTLGDVISQVGWAGACLLNEKTGRLIDGHARQKVALQNGDVPIPVLIGSWSEEEEALILATLDPIGGMAIGDQKAYQQLIDQINVQSESINDLIKNIEEQSGKEVERLIAEIGDQSAGQPSDTLGQSVGPAPEALPPDQAGPSLSERFGIPPFSVLSAREGWWQNRKRAWLALGIQSELGRGEGVWENDPKERDPRERSKPHNGKRFGAAFGQDIIKGEGQIKGLHNLPLMGRVPDYYKQKREVEARLGRPLEKEDFETNYLVIPENQGISTTGTSVFDPVLSELVYQWFCPKAGTILDPFAGGSVRGIVAGWLGKRYFGNDLRAEQIEANRLQAQSIFAADAPKPQKQKPSARGADLQVDTIEGIRVVRDDLIFGGTKRRVLEKVLAANESQEFVYATPAYGFAQIALAVACQKIGKKATIFVAERKDPHPRTKKALEAGANIVPVPNGYLVNVQAKAREYAKETGATLLPFGLDHPVFVDAIAELASTLEGPAPTEVWCVAGSGVLTRALQKAWPNAQHHAVQIGKDPKVGQAKLWAAPEKFEEDAINPPPFPSCSNYDAKAWQFIKANASPGALFWNLGADIEVENLAIEAPAEKIKPVWSIGDSCDIDKIHAGLQADLVFSCPPYADLEIYSDDPKDISGMDYPDFLAKYREIISKACSLLKPNRFAVFVVGEVRDKNGHYRNFVGDTVEAFRAAGLHFYNEAIFVTPLGSVPIRVGKQFTSTRKLGKTHQNVLVFVKGDARKAVEALGECVFGELPDPDQAEGEPDGQA